jgi:hypothetical protein
MLRRGLCYLAVGVLVIVPSAVLTVHPAVAKAAGPGAPAGAGADACKTWCLWDQPRFTGNMVELPSGTCKDFGAKSAANNTADGKSVIFFYRQPGCQGKPWNPYGMKSKTQSAHVEAASAIVKPMG